MTLRTLLPLALLLPAVGCYDAGSKEDCVGLGCPAGFQWPDGGEIRLEHIKTPDGGDLTRVTAFFIADQNPDYFPPPVLGSCFPNPPKQADDRVYIDAGENIVFSGGGVDFTVPRKTKDDNMGNQVTDFINRKHDIVYLYSTNDPPPTDFFNAFFQTQTAEQLAFSDRLAGNYMPPAVEQLTPAPGVLQIHHGQPLDITWKFSSPPDPDVVSGGAIVFAGGPGTTPYLCVVPNTGHFTVPADIIDKLPPNGGIMQVGYATNRAVLSDTDRIVNLWASECDMSVWTFAQ